MYMYSEFVFYVYRPPSIWPRYTTTNHPHLRGYFRSDSDFRLQTTHVLKVLLVNNKHYLLGTGETYGPTAQHSQDSPIFFIQLNYVDKNKNKVLLPYVKFPCHKVPQHWEFHFLFLNSTILHRCIFGNSCFFLSVEISFTT